MTAGVPSAGTAHTPSVLDPAGRRALQRRCLTVVVVSQVLGGAGLAAGVTVGALLAQDMLGGERLAGVPVALFTLGAALAAYCVGRLSNVAGRRNGLAAGFAAGAVGAVGVVAAAVLHDPVLLLGALFVYGSGTATNLQARYAATDLAEPARRGTAVSIAMVATTFGAVAGPSSVEATGRVASGLGVPALAGPFLLGALAYGLAGLVLLVFLRPDPLWVARAGAAEGLRTGGGAGPRRGGEDGAAGRRTTVHLLVTGATAMVLTQLAMVAIMTMTPVHMREHGHSLGDVGLVIGLHVAAMFLPSPLTGVLVDRVGRMPMVVAAGTTLLAAGAVAATAPGDSTALLALVLVLLGLGWNFGLISGTALVVDGTPVRSRARTQGAVDVLVSLAGSGGGAVSGWVVAGPGFGALALSGGLLALLLLPTVLWSASTARSMA